VALLTSALEEWTTGARQRFEHRVATELSDARYEHGVWSAAYVLTGQLVRPGRAAFLEILHQVRGHETGWVPWWVPTREEIRPRPVDGLIECWHKDGNLGGPSHSDFWRASPDGMMYLLRGYQEDDAESLRPGTELSLTIPAWRAAEVLLHASRLATALGAPEAEVDLQVRWEGLRGRSLSPWPSYRYYLDEKYVCLEDSATGRLRVVANEIEDSLPRLVSVVTAPLYESFDFFRPPQGMLEAEIRELRANRF
jgi:transcriptional regulator with XRE-family HTH domain